MGCFISSKTTFGSCEKVCNGLQLERHLLCVEQKWNGYANELLPQDLCFTFEAVRDRVRDCGPVTGLGSQNGVCQALFYAFIEV